MLQERANEAERARAAQGKKVQQRPDLKAWKALQDQKLSLDHYKTAGHVPGHVTGGRRAPCGPAHPSSEIFVHAHAYACEEAACTLSLHGAC